MAFVKLKGKTSVLLSSDARCPGHEDMVVCGLAVSSESRQEARGTPLLSVWGKSRFQRTESVSIFVVDPQIHDEHDSMTIA